MVGYSRAFMIAFAVRHYKTAFVSLLFFGSAFTVNAQSTRARIIITNPLRIPRVGEIINIDLSQFINRVSGYYPMVKKGNKVLVTQLIGDDDNGKRNNLLIEVNLKPASSDTLSLEWVKNDPEKSFAQITSVRFSLKTKTEQPEKEIAFLKRGRGFVQDIANPIYQMEGPGIENDKVAFRVFFDIRNSMDIYGKVTDEPILEKVGVGAGWHTLQPWGMDIFKTGNSLGAGGMAVRQDGQIFRLADADTSTFQALYEGPLEAAFRISFKNWDVGSGHRDGSETISMRKGTFYYKNLLKVNLEPGQELLSGIANFTGDSASYKRDNLKISSLSTYGPQAEGTGDKLGVAILFPTPSYSENHTAPANSVIPNTSYVALKNLPASEKVLYFAACWVKTDGRFSTKEGFEEYLRTAALLLANPIHIKIKYNQ